MTEMIGWNFMTQEECGTMRTKTNQGLDLLVQEEENPLQYLSTKTKKGIGPHFRRRENPLRYLSTKTKKRKKLKLQTKMTTSGH